MTGTTSPVNLAHATQSLRNILAHAAQSLRNITWTVIKSTNFQHTLESIALEKIIIIRREEGEKSNRK